MIYRQFTATGSAAAGYDWLRRLDANTVIYTSTPDDMYIMLDRGVGSITLWNLQDALIQPPKNKRPWSYVMPASGAPVLLDGVGVVAHSRSVRVAQAFEDFLLEPQLQLQLARDYYQIPAMELPAQGRPAWLANLGLKEMKLDWAALGQNQQVWMDYWFQNIKGKAGK
jgi:iron(III) transport system substrate-binding protein